MTIAVQHISKQFGRERVLDDVTLSFEEGSMTVLLGPSGCGKSTLLRIIAGLESPDTGSVLIDGRDAAYQAIGDRGIGFVFQHYALFKHLNVVENIAFGLRVRPASTRPDETTIRAKVRSLLELVQLEKFANAYPDQLSGGQRQRVALARALAVDPRVLLLDEPFGALDAQVRKELRRWLRHLHEELSVTTVFVTHDQEEAVDVAENMVVMNHGRVEQTGNSQSVYENPATPFVFSFLGGVNLFHGQVTHGILEVDGIPFGGLGTTEFENGPALACVRPHELEVERYATGAEGLVVQLRRAYAFGPFAQLQLEHELRDQHIDAVIPSERFTQLDLKNGETLVVRPRKGRVFAAQAS